MRKLFGGLVVAVLALSLATVAQAQRRTTTSAAMGGAKHEFGIDLGVAYVKPSNVSGCMSIQAPVDVRFGFVPRSGKMMWEPRLSLTFNTVGGNTSYLFTPQVNLLYANTPGGHRRGMYFTGGAGPQVGDLRDGSGEAGKLPGGHGWREADAKPSWREGTGFPMG